MNNHYMTESYRKALRKVVEMVDDIENDKKLGEMIREYIEEEFPKD